MLQQQASFAMVYGIRSSFTLKVLYTQSCASKMFDDHDPSRTPGLKLFF